MAKYTYNVEIKTENGEWYPVVREEARGFAHGYLFGYHDATWPPNHEIRMIRSDGKVIDSYPENAEVSVGMVAGFPTAEQYEAAAARALEKAKIIRDRKVFK